jgi:hypothetical protein
MSGTGGIAGTSAGGTSGTGGTTSTSAGGTSGTGGIAGTNGGGSSGKGGSAGTNEGGTAGTSGGSAGTTAQGGAGGGAAAGNGGAGGAGGLTLAAACLATCETQWSVGLVCSGGGACPANCTGLSFDTLAPTEYAALIQCEAANLGASDYECGISGLGSAMAVPVAASACETEVCAWTCADRQYVEINTWMRCCR